MQRYLLDFELPAVASRPRLVESIGGYDFDNYGANLHAREESLRLANMRNKILCSRVILRSRETPEEKFLWERAVTRRWKGADLFLRAVHRACINTGIDMGPVVGETLWFSCLGLAPPPPPEIEIVQIESAGDPSPPHQRSQQASKNSKSSANAPAQKQGLRKVTTPPVKATPKPTPTTKSLTDMIVSGIQSVYCAHLDAEKKKVDWSQCNTVASWYFYNIGALVLYMCDYQMPRPDAIPEFASGFEEFNALKKAFDKLVSLFYPTALVRPLYSANVTQAELSQLTQRLLAFVASGWIYPSAQMDELLTSNSEKLMYFKDMGDKCYRWPFPFFHAHPAAFYCQLKFVAHNLMSDGHRCMFLSPDFDNVIEELLEPKKKDVVESPGDSPAITATPADTATLVDPTPVDKVKAALLAFKAPEFDGKSCGLNFLSDLLCEVVKTKDQIIYTRKAYGFIANSRWCWRSPSFQVKKEPKKRRAGATIPSSSRSKRRSISESGSQLPQAQPSESQPELSSVRKDVRISSESATPARTAGMSSVAVMAPTSPLAMTPSAPLASAKRKAAPTPRPALSSPGNFDHVEVGGLPCADKLLVDGGKVVCPAANNSTILLPIIQDSLQSVEQFLAQVYPKLRDIAGDTAPPPPTGDDVPQPLSAEKRYQNEILFFDAATRFRRAAAALRWASRFPFNSICLPSHRTDADVVLMFSHMKQVTRYFAVFCDLQIFKDLPNQKEPYPLLLDQRKREWISGFYSRSSDQVQSIVHDLCCGKYRDTDPNRVRNNVAFWDDMQQLVMERRRAIRATVGNAPMPLDDETTH